MSYKVSEKRKIREKRGTGHFKTYKPWIKPREIHGLSTTTDLYDPRVERMIACLSQGEKFAYLCLSWDDSVYEIREQFPLELEDTLAICETYGIVHPQFNDEYTHFTTDLLVDYRDGTRIAYSVKANHEFLNEKRTCEKLFVEKMYWEKRNVIFRIVIKDTDINQVYANNIGYVIKYFPISEVHTPEDLILHLIAHKYIEVDLSAPHLPIKELVQKYFENKEEITALLEERKK